MRYRMANDGVTIHQLAHWQRPVPQAPLPHGGSGFFRLPGRTTCLPDPVMGAHMDGVVGLRIALESNGPIDLLTIMLGTNDAQYHHARSAEQIVGGRFWDRIASGDLHNAKSKAGSMW